MATSTSPSQSKHSGMPSRGGLHWLRVLSEPSRLTQPGQGPHRPLTQPTSFIVACDRCAAAPRRQPEAGVPPLYRQTNLAMGRRKKGKRPVHERVSLQLPPTVKEVWGMDFVSDSLVGGKRLKYLTVADDVSHESMDNPGGLRQDTDSKAVKLTPGLQSQVLLKLGGRRWAIVLTRLETNSGHLPSPPSDKMDPKSDVFEENIYASQRYPACQRRYALHHHSR